MSFDAVERTITKFRQIKAEIRRQEGQATEQFYAELGRLMLRCAGFGLVGRSADKYSAGCGKQSPVRKWAYQIALHYNPNTGDPNGGYWYQGKPDSDSLICPRCGLDNYIYNHPEKAKILKIMELRTGLDIDIDRIFADVTYKEQR